MRTSFDRIATECRKVSRCLKCWDSLNGSMYIEIKIGEPRTKYSNSYLLNKAKEIANKYDNVIVSKPYYSCGSDYDCYIIDLKIKENK